MNLTVELNDFAFDGLGAAVRIGQVDTAIGAISVTPNRQAVLDFSNVYYAGQDGVLARADSSIDVKSGSALGNNRVAVQHGSVYETMGKNLVATGKMPSQNLLVYSDIQKAIDDLKAQRTDLVWLDLLPAQNFAKDTAIKIVAKNLNQQLYAIAMRKGATTLQAKINDALTQLQNDGTLAKLAQQYLKLAPDQIPTPQPLPTPAGPTPTPAPPACVYGAKWIADLSYDDHNMTSPPVLQPGQAFTKGWRMMNNGTCPWTTAFRLAYASGNVPAAQMGGQPIPVTREVPPGATFDFNVNLIAPTAPGTYQGFWTMRDDTNTPFGETVWVGITVPGAPTPVPAATETPSPNITFTADPTTITAGQPVQFTWNVLSAKAVYFYHEGQNWQDHGVPGQGQSTEYPPSTVNYYLRVINTDDSVTVKTRTITVNPAPGAPSINEFSVQPQQLSLGQCVNITWDTSDADRIALKANGQLFWDYAPVSGSTQQCPTSDGQWTYRIEAYGPNGTSVQEQTVSVGPGPTQH